MEKSVLIVLDIQNANMDQLRALTDVDRYVEAVNAAIDHAHAAEVPVVQVRTAFRAGYPDASERNAMTAAVKAAGLYGEESEAAALHPALRVADGDVRVTKRRASAFHATDLDLVLRSLGAGTVVLAGVSTSSAVLSAASQARDLDYRVVVLEDLCRDRDDEVHRVVMTKILGRHATVISSKDWIAGSQS